ncbi:hypothetical protein [Leminorella grimontii]|uniref:hypothetical protein n=1 Tax=Leminorella grimontii TaxID=82981 RepID=UPI00141AC441|nr:hypothetical protein [Leminorella grimontii]
MSRPLWPLVKARRLAAEKYSDDLKAEQQRYRELSDFSEQLLDEYHQTSDELDALKQQHERSVSYAVTHDGQAFTGLGPDGLRLYRAALGYSAKEGGKILPSDTGGTVARSHRNPRRRRRESRRRYSLTRRRTERGRRSWSSN